jgi:mannose-6-phosphate isomerase-like protein (cupin superfamily)
MWHNIIKFVCAREVTCNFAPEDSMRPNSSLLQSLVAAGLFIAASPIFSQPAKPHPLTKPLSCPQGDCPLLQGIPQTAGMRSGFVRLKPGETVGWHTTGKNEEALVILHGQGEALIDGQARQLFNAPVLVYIPPATRHNVENTGKELLEYVYVVAPAKAQ